MSRSFWLVSFENQGFVTTFSAGHACGTALLCNAGSHTMRPLQQDRRKHFVGAEHRSARGSHRVRPLQQGHCELRYIPGYYILQT